MFFAKDLILEKTDAEFVDIMHCNSGKLGLETAIGHADFYPNGGSVQLDCPSARKDFRGFQIWLIL